MKKSVALALFLLIVLPAPDARAQKFDWGLDFEYLFANSEYDASHNLNRNSHTLHAVNASAFGGLLLTQGENVEHRVIGGLNILKEMGAGTGLLSACYDLLLYYDARVALPGGAVFEGAAGLYPRSFLSDSYDGPIIYDENAFMQNILQGMMFKYDTPGLRAELALDWMGKKGDLLAPERRERFQILTSGAWTFVPSLSLGWAGSFYHYACSPECPNVVDNHIFNPYLEWAREFDRFALSVSAGGIFTYQRDRAVDSSPKLPMGLLSRQKLSWWQLTLDNEFYWGDDLMPYYDSSYAGVPYGDTLYFGDPAFRTGVGRPSWFDLVSVRYEPQIISWLRVYVRLDFLLGESVAAAGIPFYRGWRQTAGVKIDF